MSGLAGQRSSEGSTATERSADDRSSGQIDSRKRGDGLSVTAPVALRASTLAARSEALAGRIDERALPAAAAFRNVLVTA